MKLPRHLLGAEAVGDLAGVAAAVLLPQVADGEARQTPSPAGVRGQRASILQPAHSGTGVAARRAGELHTLARVDLAGLETVQDGGGGLVGIWGERSGGRGQRLVSLVGTKCVKLKDTLGPKLNVIKKKKILYPLSESYFMDPNGV